MLTDYVQVWTSTTLPSSWTGWTLLFDVNILVYEHREDTDEHPKFREWIENELNSDRAYGVCDLALSGFIRVVTHPRVFVTPTPLTEALRFANALRSRDNAVVVEPGPDQSKLKGA